MKLNCLIVDDEPVARKGLEEYVRDVDFLTLVAKCENAARAVPYLEQGVVDLIFLDINMPRISGIEFLRSLKDPPMVIFTTAYPEYALEGYALDVLDFLVKPIPFDRFVRSAQKAMDFFRMKRKAGDATTNVVDDFFFVKCDGRFEKVFFREVLYAEALQNYVIIHTTSRKFITYITFRGLEAQLPLDQFLRVHKSYIVSVPQVSAIEGHEIVIGAVRLPISRNLKDVVTQRILGNNLLKRE